MECSRTSVGQLPLDEFVNVVAAIYSVHDKHRSIWDVWCHTLHHAAGVAHQVRIGGIEKKLYEEIADFSLWLFTTVLKMKGNFGESAGTIEESLIRIGSSCSDLLWHKYPNICPLCSTDRIPSTPGLIPCKCSGQITESEEKDARRQRLLGVRNYGNNIRHEKPSSIDAWQQMFADVFRKSLASLSLRQIVLHIMEELGEASDAMIRMYTYKEETFRLGEPNWRQVNLEGQLADVFSRTFALAEKLHLLKSETQSSDAGPSEPVRLSGIIWKRYGSDGLRSFFCPFCKQPVCCCPIILVPATRPVEELLRKFQLP